METKIDNEKWFRISDDPPPDRLVVETKIDDEGGCRNVQDLKRVGNLYYTPDGAMYVYYTPTHWRFRK